MLVLIHIMIIIIQYHFSGQIQHLNSNSNCVLSLWSKSFVELFIIKEQSPSPVIFFDVVHGDL